MPLTSRLYPRLLAVILIGLFLPLSLLAGDYKWRDHAVYYKGRVIPTADMQTFVDLGLGYAKDHRFVYYEGKILPYVDPSTFRLLPPDYPIETDSEGEAPGHRAYRVIRNEVFYHGRRIEASASRFQDLGMGYAKDAFHVFYRGKIIESASAPTFQHVGGRYFKDAFHVYHDGQEMPDVSTSSFQYDGDGYAHDAFRTYRHGRIISE